MKKDNIEQRNQNIIVNTDGHGSINYKISIPKKWADTLEFSKENRSAIMKFDGEKIIIEKNIK